MPIGRPVATIVLSPAEKEKLTLIANRPKSNQRDALRARIILEASGGLSNTEIARRERVTLPTVGKWRSRYARQKIEALADAPRSGAPRSIDDKKVEEVLTKTLETTPRARTHWSSRLMAKEAGISEHSVLRIWRAFGLKPHRVDSFKLSADPMFVEKVRDIVGLYLNPPDKAIVLCVDEKSQTQALERSQPILPLRPGLPERQTHDYVRHGTLSLFAAYDAATGRVLGRCHQRHRHQEFLAFLGRIDAAFSDDGKSQLHLIIDNYSTHKTPKVHRWLLRHPRFHLHFTPTGSSWLNMVERFFARITTEAIRRGSFSSVRQLQAAIDAYLAEHNKEPKPFTWTASADSIFRKLENSLS
jgi:transposase